MILLAGAATDPTSALVVSGERSLAAEFPPESQARGILGAIGAGERSYSLIARAAGGVPQASMSRSLQVLTAKRMISADSPLSTHASRDTRYSVADPHLRFWLAFLGPYLDEIERGRGDLVLARITASWPSWRGRAIEPVILESLRRLPPGPLPDGTRAIGGYWTRTNEVEVDIVGADREPVARAITFVGSIKWQERRPFDAHDLVALARHRDRVPGAEENTPMVAVSRTGTRVDGVTTLGPDEIVGAWQGSG